MLYIKGTTKYDNYMETPIPTITDKVLLAWDQMSAMWAAEETSWPSLEEATETYFAAEADYEEVTFLMPDLEERINHLRCELEVVSGEQWDIVRDQLEEKEAELLSCEERLVLIEQHLKRRREIYYHVMIAHYRKIQKERFPDRPWPARQSECPWIPDEYEELQEDGYKDIEAEVDVEMEAEEAEVE